MRQRTVEPRFGALIYDAGQFEKRLGKKATRQVEVGLAQLNVPIDASPNGPVPRNPQLGVLSQLDQLGLHVWIQAGTKTLGGKPHKVIRFQLLEENQDQLTPVPGTVQSIPLDPGYETRIPYYLQSTVTASVEAFKREMGRRLDEVCMLIGRSNFKSEQMPECQEQFGLAPTVPTLEALQAKLDTQG
jgi:hypothetical protein